ncbi:MAG: hypothetical protein AB7E32_04755 [Desulfovibrio sp.]
MPRKAAILAGSVLLLLLGFGPAMAELATLTGRLTELDGRYLVLDRTRGAVELRGENLESLVGKRVWVSGDLENGESEIPVLDVDDIEEIQNQE